MTVQRILHALLVLSALPTLAGAQNLEQRIAAVGSGTVRLSFAARPGVCGDGMHNIRVVDSNDEWEEDCEPQPVRVALQVHDRWVTEVRSYVGGRWRPGVSATDLGSVRPQDAAAYFISLAERDAAVSGDPLLPAALADSITIWPALLRLARTRAVPQEIRRTAVFWLGEAAGAAAARTLDSRPERRPARAGTVRGNTPIGPAGNPLVIPSV